MRTNRDGFAEANGSSFALDSRIHSAAPWPPRMLPRGTGAVNHFLRAAYRTFSLSNDSPTRELLKLLYDPHEQTLEELRALLRESAQPVAVLTSLVPRSLSSNGGYVSVRFQGATLSSFSTIAFDPYPPIAFSLRMLSHIASALKHTKTSTPVCMVVNLLSSSQAPVDVRFSRPDLFPQPFDGLDHSSTQEGLPALTDCLGALLPARRHVVAPPKFEGVRSSHPG